MEIRTKMITLATGESIPLTKNWFSEAMGRVRPDPIHAASACARAGAGDTCMSCKFQKDNGTC